MPDWKTELFKRLDALGEKLGTTAGHLWEVLVRQGMAEGIGDLVLAFLCLVVFVICYKIVRWMYKEAPLDKPDSIYDMPWKARYLVPGIIATIVGIFSGVGIFVNLYQGVLWAVNPEYFALEKVLSLFGK